jgi:hypothetical protein
MTFIHQAVRATRKTRTLLFLLLVLCGAFMVSCRRKEGPVEIVVGSPGVAVEGSTTLLIALPLDNTGKHEARDVNVRELRIAGANRQLPVTLPYHVATLLTRTGRWWMCGLMSPDSTLRRPMNWRLRDATASATTMMSANATSTPGSNL